MVEILMSTYNGQQFLKEQLDSILNQSFKEWTLLIRDDSSSDNSSSIIDEYCRKYPEKVRRIEPGKNIGCLHSFEELLKNSDADYFMFCDQDDVWLPDKVKHAYETITKVEKDGMPAIACSDLTVVDSSLRTINDSFFAYSGIKFKKLNSSKMLAVANYVTGCTMIFNKKAKEVSLPFGDHAILHDVWIAQRVLYCGGTITLMPTSDILYRQHTNNTVGAIKGDSGLKKIRGKLKDIRNVLAKNLANFRQGRESSNVSFLSFLFSKFKYLLLP